MTGEGLRLSSGAFVVPETCDFKSKFHLRLAVVLGKSNQIVKDFMSPFFTKCQLQFDERTLDIFHYPYRPGADLSDIVIFLKSRGFNSKEISNITNIWNIKNEKNNFKEILIDIEKLKNTNSELRKYRIHNSLIDKAQKVKSRFLRTLLLATSYGEIGNQALFAQYVNELLSINKSIYAIDLRQSYTTSDNISNYYEIIRFSFSRLQERIKDEVTLKMFESNFKFLKTNKHDIQLKNTSLDWSLVELREYMKTYRYGLKFPAYWISELIGRTSVKEVDDFIRTFHENGDLENLLAIDFWIFKDNYPVTKKAREVFTLKLGQVEQRDPLISYTTLFLIENNIIKKELSDVNSQLSKPVFTLKRKLLHEMLSAGHESTFIIYNLLDMGEEKDEFIWWLLL